MNAGQPVQYFETATTPAEKPKITGEERDQLLLQWKKLKEQATAAKEAELALREKIVYETDLFDSEKEEGTQSVSLGKGWKVKGVKKLNWKVTEEVDGVTVEEALDRIRDVAGAMAADELVKFKPSLSVSTFRKLTKAEKEIIMPFLSYTEGAPGLELIEPKEKN